MIRRHILILIIALAMPLGLCAQQRHSDGLDDVLQHAPMAAVWGLRLGGVTSKSGSWGRLALSAGSAYVLSAATTYGLKQVVSERRPDHSDCRSFPSGHATFAFAGATVLRHEYGHLSPWVSIGGYGLATLVSIDRVVRDRHYLHDVVAGAAIGFAATELTYYVRKHIIKNDNVALTFTGSSFDLAVRL